MKSISSPAMAAIEAGEAIVTGAVEILPRGSIVSSVVNVAATAFGGSLAARTTTITEFSASDTVILSKPPVAYDSRLSWNAYSPWAADNSTTPTPPPVLGQTWNNYFEVYGNNGGGDVLLFAPVLDANNYLTETAAFNALAGQLPDELTGYDTYKVIAPFDPNAPDNRGGLSVLLTSTSGSADPIRVWGGHGPITIGGQIYQGIGHHGLAQQTAGAVGGVAQGLQLTLSGIEPYLLEHFDGDEVKGASVVVLALIFGPDGKTLLDASVWDRGRVDAVDTSETIGGAAAIVLAVETAARGLGSSGARQRSDSDQRLINPNDGYFKNTAFAGQKKLYWGGRRPVSAGGGRVSTTEFRDMMLRYRDSVG